MTRMDADSPTQADTAPWPTRSDAPTLAPGPVATSTVDTAVAPPPPPPLATEPPLVAASPPDRRIGAGMLLALGVAALVAVAILLAWVLTHRNSSNPAVRTVLVTTGGAQSKSGGGSGGAVMLVAVPHLVGDQVSDAQQTLRQLGFKTTVKNISSSKPTGTVLDQAPAAAANAQHGSVVHLTIAAAPSRSASQTTTAASSTTAPSATTTGSTTTTITTTTTTTTTAAAPPTPQTATVPDVSGKDEPSAMQALVAAGVIPSIVFVPAQDPLGTVVQTAKPAGTQLGYRDHMQVNLSSGPGDKPLEQVPSVVGQTLEQAVSTMQATGLRLIYVKLPVTTQAAAGKIVQQTPAGGQAPHNAQILVFLGAYRK